MATLTKFRIVSLVSAIAMFTGVLLGSAQIASADPGNPGQAAPVIRVPFGGGQGGPGPVVGIGAGVSLGGGASSMTPPAGIGVGAGAGAGAGVTAGNPALGAMPPGAPAGG